MASNGEARQYSFTMGEISPEKYYTPNEVTYQQGLAKAENVVIKASGGIQTRAGTEFIDQLSNLPSVRDYDQSVSFVHPITKKEYTLLFARVEAWDVAGSGDKRYSLYLDGFDIMDSIYRSDLGDGFSIFDGANGGKIGIPDGVKLSFVSNGEGIVILPAVRLYSNAFAANTSAEGFLSDGFQKYTETILSLRFSKNYFNANIPSPVLQTRGLFLQSNFGGQLTTPSVTPATQVKVVAGGAGTTPSASARVSYVVTATREDKSEEIYMTIRSNDTASSDILPDVHIRSNQDIDPTSTGKLYYPDSGWRTSLTISNISLSKEQTHLPKYKYFSIYRGVENDPNMITTFSLVNRFPVLKSGSNTFTIRFTDYGETDASITPPMDRSFFINAPSIAQLGDGSQVKVYSPNRAISGTFYQGRLFLGFEASKDFDTAAKANSIVASRLGGTSHFAMPLITNPADAFEFHVPEERGGFLTHLSSTSRLIAYTNVAVFVFMGDDAGTLTPTTLNPVKVMPVGAKKDVPPCSFGEYSFFAMEGVQSIGFVRITSLGEVSSGDALPISRHFLEDGDEIKELKALNGPDTSQVRIQVLTSRGKIWELTGTEGVFGLTKLSEGLSSLEYKGLYDNQVPLTPRNLFGEWDKNFTNYIHSRISGMYLGKKVAPLSENQRVLKLGYSNLTVQAMTSRFYNPYVDVAMRLGSFDKSSNWEVSPYGMYFYDVGMDSWQTDIFVNPSSNVNISFDSAVLDWGAGEEIDIDLSDDVTGASGVIFPQYGVNSLGRKFYIKMYLLVDGEEKVISGEIIEIEDIEGGSTISGSTKLVFSEDVPAAFRDKEFKLACNNSEHGAFTSVKYLNGVSGIATISTNKLVAPTLSLNQYFSSVGRVMGWLPSGTEVPLAMFADGEIISETADDSSAVKAVIETILGQPYFVIDFNGMDFSAINLGIPYISKIQTLPLEVAVGQGDSISDAGKLISAAAISMYLTDSLVIGEVGADGQYYTESDFFSEEDPTKIVKFSGVKEHNFSASWNKHGMIELRSKPFRGFSISSITPKGNVSI